MRRRERRQGAQQGVVRLDALEDQRGLEQEDVSERARLQEELLWEDRKEEVEWKQRSRQKWLCEGDANARFFHSMASCRRRKNYIHGIRMGDTMVVGEAQLGRSLREHFVGMSRRRARDGWGWRGSCVESLSEEHASQLVAPFTEKEVRDAVWRLNADGAPGPDGFPVSFYKAFWDLLKEEVMAVLNEFRDGNRGFEKINRALFFLLPKKENPMRVEDYRPIALSNAIYLIVAKVLANRLKLVMNEVILHNQSSFIQDRQMADGLIMASEICLQWRRENMKGLAWKIDFEKA